MYAQQKVWDGLDICSRIHSPRKVPDSALMDCRSESHLCGALQTLQIAPHSCSSCLEILHGLLKDVGSQHGMPRSQVVHQLCGTGLQKQMHVIVGCAAIGYLCDSCMYLFIRVRFAHPPTIVTVPIPAADIAILGYDM